MSIKNQPAEQVSSWVPPAFFSQPAIKEGLEILGALPAYGPWFSYKAKTKNGLVSVLRVFPFSIQPTRNQAYHQGFLDFMSKFDSIKEEPFAFVFPIKNWGVTQEGSYPYLEFDDQPDQYRTEAGFSHKGVRPVTETIHIAEQLSRTLALCHNAGILHGALTPHCIRYNTAERNYFLDDFGAAILTEDQRKQFYQHTELGVFLAPEQHRGQLLFQTDVYALGMVLYYFLTGEVYETASKVSPSVNDDFSSKMKSQSQMNSLAMTTIAGFPSGNAIPAWLSNMVSICLKTDPAERFSNGIELYDHVLYNQLLSTREKVKLTDPPKLDIPRRKDPVTVTIKTEVGEKVADNTQNTSSITKPTVPTKLKKSNFFVSSIIIVCISFLVTAFVSMINRRDGDAEPGTVQANNDLRTLPQPGKKVSPTTTHQDQKLSVPPKTSQPEVVIQQSISLDPGKVAAFSEKDKVNSTIPVVKKKISGQKREGSSLDLHTGLGEYQVVSKAYFYTLPDESTRRNAHIVHWNNAILKPIKATEDFIYIVFTNHWGQTSKGWLRKKDIREIKE